MPARIFVSHVYEDIVARDTLVSWARQGKLGLGVEITGESDDVRQHGRSAILNHLRPMLRDASAVIVLVGNDTHNHHWIEYEAQYALSHQKKVIAVRIPGTTGAPPTVIARLGLVATEPTALQTALRT